MIHQEPRRWGARPAEKGWRLLVPQWWSPDYSSLPGSGARSTIYRGPRAAVASQIACSMLAESAQSL